MVFVLLLAAVAVISALTLPTVMSWMPSDPSAAAALAPASGEVVTPPTLTQWLVALVPANPVKAAADGALLPLIVFTLGFSLAVAGLAPEQRQLILRLAEAVAATMLGARSHGSAAPIRWRYVSGSGVRGCERGVGS